MDILQKRPFNLLIWITLSSLILFLSSCSHVKRDGPPDYYVDETKIPNAKPKLERLSKYGNMTSYMISGKRYYTLKTCKNFEEIGVASWYGTLFHERLTSSGEPYNMLGMTAAHKSLPLPTYVEVTNLKNHRKIIVKVNDRGPFKSDRIIDLSYVAAKKLGMLGKGTALVKVKAIDPLVYGKPIKIIAKNKTRTIIHKNYTATVMAKTKPIRTHAKSNQGHAVQPVIAALSTLSKKHVYLQVGAFENRLEAENFKKHLMNMHIAPVTIFIPVGKETLYRVQMGPFKDMATANRLTKNIK